MAPNPDCRIQTTADASEGPESSVFGLDQEQFVALGHFGLEFFPTFMNGVSLHLDGAGFFGSDHAN